jgi:outer membrane immunogenic protein
MRGMLANVVFVGRVMKSLFAAVVVAILAASPAFSADFPRTAIPLTNESRPDPATWTGFYFGLGIGGRWMDADWRATAAFDPTGARMPFDSSPQAIFSSNAFRFSGYTGYNVQIAHAFVVGVEVDVGWANNRAVLVSHIPGIGDLNFGSYSQVDGQYDGSLRPRAGYLFIDPSMLVYLTGGLAFQRVRVIATCAEDPSVCNPARGTQSFASNKILLGWTLGGGIEGPVWRNWLARIEYRYSEFDKFAFIAIPATPDSFGANAQLKTTTHTLTAGLAFKAP